MIDNKVLFGDNRRLSNFGFRASRDAFSQWWFWDCCFGRCRHVVPINTCSVRRKKLKQIIHAGEIETNAADNNYCRCHGMRRSTWRRLCLLNRKKIDFIIGTRATVSRIFDQKNVSFKRKKKARTLWQASADLGWTRSHYDWSAAPPRRGAHRMLLLCRSSKGNKFCTDRPFFSRGKGNSFGRRHR